MSSISIGAVGSVVADTTRFPGDLTIEERAQWIADEYGDEASAIVIGLVRDLNVSLVRALELASRGEPAFRKACERHLIALRAQAKRAREEAARDQQREDERRREWARHERVQSLSMLIEQHESRRRMVLAHVRAQPMAEDVRAGEIARVTAEFDTEIAALQAQLDEAVATRDARQVKGAT